MIERLKGIVSGFKADKRLMIIVALGTVGVLLLVISELIPEKSDDVTEVPYSQINSAEAYEEQLEERLEKLLGNINGAGRVSVMLTLASGDENIYATEQKQGESNSERKYVIVDNSKEETGLLLKVAEPEIRGVGIVCDGSDNANVRQEIINTVSAVLNISSNRISIAKMKNNNGG